MEKSENPPFEATDSSGQQFVMLNVEGSQETAEGQYVMDDDGNIHYIMMQEGVGEGVQDVSAPSTNEGEFYLDEAMATAALANGGQIEINGVLYQLQTSSDDPNTMMIDMSALPTDQPPIFTEQSQAIDMPLVDNNTKEEMNIIQDAKDTSNIGVEVSEFNENNVAGEGKFLTDKETTELSEFLDIKSKDFEYKADSEVMNSAEEINEEQDELIKYIQVPSGKDGQPINIQISTDKSNSAHKVIILPTGVNPSASKNTTMQLGPKFNVISKNKLIKPLQSASNTPNKSSQILQGRGRTITFDKLKSNYKTYPQTKKGSTTEAAIKKQLTNRSAISNKNKIRKFDEMDYDSEDGYNDEILVSKPTKSQSTRGKGAHLKTVPRGSKIVVASNIFQGRLNKSFMCRPTMMTKATSCNPIKVAKITQTDLSDEEEKVYIPIPFPLCVPIPVFEGTIPIPKPVPIPLPLPVPLYTPMSKEAVSSALLQLKVLYESLPEDEEDGLVAVLNNISNKENEIIETMDTNVSQPSCEMPTDMQVDAERNEASTLAEDIRTMNALVEPEENNLGSRLENDENKDCNVNGSVDHNKSKELLMLEEMNTYIPPTNVRRVPINSAGMKLKYNYGINAWRHWVSIKNQELSSIVVTGKQRPIKLIPRDPLHSAPCLLNLYLSLFVKEINKPTGDSYACDSIYYFCLGIQHYLYENGRFDNIFYDSTYRKFIVSLHQTLNDYQVKLNLKGLIVCRITEDQLWECRQLGVHSPHVLLNTLIYFNTKHFMLTTVADHKAMSFSNIIKQWKKGSNSPVIGRPPLRSVYLKYTQNNGSSSQKADSGQSLEQLENVENPHRCPVKIYEFYLLKSPESIKNRFDMFYLMPEPSCIPDSPIWFSGHPLATSELEEMLCRLKVVKEVVETQINNIPPTITYI